MPDENPMTEEEMELYRERYTREGQGENFNRKRSVNLFLKKTIKIFKHGGEQAEDCEYASH